MDIYGIKNITQKELEFDYDKYYKDMALMLKRTENKEEQNILREKARNDFNLFLDNIKIDLEVLNQSFVHLLLDINSAKLLWILYSKYDGKAALKEYTIIFVPNRHEKEFAIQIKNDNFFKCINNMKILKKRNLNYKNVSIELTNTNFNKVLSVKIIN